jgi:hypothetical protein
LENRIEDPAWIDRITIFSDGEADSNQRIATEPQRSRRLLRLARAGALRLFALLARFGTALAESPTKDFAALRSSVTFAHATLSEKKHGCAARNPLEFLNPSD